MEDPKAILFDLGGTVFDWETTVDEEMQRLSEEMDCPSSGILGQMAA